LSQSSLLSRAVSSVLGAWQRFWFAEIPPHIYGLLRILIGLIACATLLGLRDLPAFWSLDGIVPASDRGLGVKAFLLSHGLGTIAGRGLFFFSLASFASMALGFRTGLAVPLSLVSSLVQISWNVLPLSGAQAVVQVVLFCLIWTDCGAVWSVDAWLAAKREVDSGGQGPPLALIAPLRLVRFQVAMIYLSTGLWKLFSEQWRDGSALHYVLNNHLFRRYPVGLPVSLDWLATAATYGTLFWELGFAFMLLYAPTRRLALVAGVLIHIGMLATIEIGPFSWVMLATYTAFLDPWKVPTLPKELLRDVPANRRSALSSRPTTAPVVGTPSE
jgi:hypothetical protein